MSAPGHRLGAGSRAGPPPRPQSGPAHVAELMTASGLSNEAVLDLLERMEAMAGAEAGPLQELRLANARLEADMLEFAAESARRLERVRELEEEAEGHVRELAKAEAVRLELRRAKEHSEHMEFLATQYSEQSAKLQALPAPPRASAGRTRPAAPCCRDPRPTARRAPPPGSGHN